MDWHKNHGKNISLTARHFQFTAIGKPVNCRHRWSISIWIWTFL